LMPVSARPLTGRICHVGHTLIQPYWVELDWRWCRQSHRLNARSGCWAVASSVILLKL